ncbi:hypothetical protein Zmor_022320 [Zophobas morio]|uniref:Serpin domain-containing protein n=1 Tax=Zophobas morio TaxID=2755281 RepID=A0AA38M5A9_9CUCU|nr:hypothetical protein Zmor_022320 [Zophobas morio]
MTLLVFQLLMAAATAQNQPSKVIEANNRFTSELYKQLIKTETGNLILSPLSADTVLALLHSGCEGSTAQELAQTLHLPNDKKQIQTEEKNLLGQLQKNDKVACNIANALFAQKDFKIKDTFLTVAKDYFDALSETLDFGKPQQAADIINKWVENKTHNVIKNLVTPDALTADTILVLVNALRFKGNWSVQFSVSNTQKGDFYRTANDVLKVDFLHHSRKHFKYHESKSLKAEFLELSFANDDFSMVFVLPQAKDGLSELEKHACEVFDVSRQLESAYVNVAIPKFKFDNTMDLKATLQSLGASKIFDPAQADLSGISGKKGDLVVSKVVQKAFIDLNEGGVEAAAATCRFNFCHLTTTERRRL